MVFKIFGVGLLCTSFLILLCGGVAVSCRVDFGGVRVPRVLGYVGRGMFKVSS